MKHAFTDSKGSPNSKQNKFKDTLPDIVKLHETQAIEKKGDFAGGPVVRTLSFHCRIQSLVRGLRYHIMHGKKKVKVSIRK